MCCTVTESDFIHTGYLCSKAQAITIARKIPDTHFVQCMHVIAVVPANLYFHTVSIEVHLHCTRAKVEAMVLSDDLLGNLMRP